MFLSGQVNFFSQLVLGQVDFCNISTALYYRYMSLSNPYFKGGDKIPDSS